MDAGARIALEKAQAAVQAGDWPVARQRFEEALELEASPEALLGLADALWWLGETGASVRRLERAYAALRRRADHAHAVLAAVSLCLIYCASLGNHAAARGWVARANRLVEDFELRPLEGWVLLCRAVVSEEGGDPAAAERLAREAHAAARATGDGDLELCSLSVIGTALVAMGRVADGVALLDEAMAGSLGGDANELGTVVMTSCQTIICCDRAGDVTRARQWVRAADEFNRRYGSPHLYAVCRTHYGSLLFATGRWDDAEAELRAALKIGSDAEPALRAEALAKLAELRLAQGRLGEAERLIEGISEPAGVLVAAAVHLAHGEPAVAAAILERRLGEIGDECLEAAAVLELLAAAEPGRGDLARRAERLAELGERLDCAVMVARARRTVGRLLLAAGDAGAAAPHLERALAGFRELEMPLDLERSRLLLARTRAGAAREVAIAETRQALAGFERLGAARDADAAAAFLRSLGVKAARSGPRGIGVLTKREREVLELLAEGLSNPEIAERLVVSRKTVEHHVARVLWKLGLRGRAEAAAYAVRESASK